MKEVTQPSAVFDADGKCLHVCNAGMFDDSVTIVPLAPEDGYDPNLLALDKKTKRCKHKERDIPLTQPSDAPAQDLVAEVAALRTELAQLREQVHGTGAAVSDIREAGGADGGGPDVAGKG